MPKVQKVHVSGHYHHQTHAKTAATATATSTTHYFQFSTDHSMLSFVHQVSQRRIFVYCWCNILHRPDALPVTQPTVSKHSMYNHHHCHNHHFHQHPFINSKTQFSEGKAAEKGLADHQHSTITANCLSVGLNQSYWHPQVIGAVRKDIRTKCSPVKSDFTHRHI